MPRNPSSALPSRLTLHGRLDDLALVWPWVESVAAAYAISAKTKFAIQLCLEEALSNIIRHGYNNRPNEALTVDCVLDGDHKGGNHELVLTIDDEAPAFDPLAAPEAENPSTIEELKPGGRGIRLMRKFAGSLAYQRLPSGNRLTLRFALPR
jgi:serine/threonine-protein kinase RsbW